MSLQEKDIEVIDAYLEGRLRGEEQFYIEEKIAYDPEFAREVREYRAVVDGIKELSRGQTIISGHPIKQTVTKNSHSNQLISLIIKSAAVLVIFSIPIFLLLIRSTGAEAIFNRHFNPYLPEIINDKIEDENSFMAKGIAAYKKSYFKRAALFFEAQLLENPEDNKASLLLGISYVAVDQVNKGTNQLKALTKEKDQKFSDEAFFFLGLAELEQNKLAEAAEAFTEVVKEADSQYKKEAEMILKEIDILEEQSRD